MIAVVMLLQPTSNMLRKWVTREDGLNYKDLSYGMLELVIVAPDGSIAIKRHGRKRSVWGEVSMPRGGTWRVYAMSLDGRACPCTVRIYMKDGTMTCNEVPGTFFSELEDILYPPVTV